ncbi:hypothetical protein C0Q70_20274 [Pomacea canaliculata]|uniref:Uncharacterized protein n=1 Tax=Pomacea canaliculata TaxID=400727 RepID=A0A2T7NF29_POMCA|nr:hypothetical protein C0Q70_20274 [Pomacea canaliculata]
MERKLQHESQQTVAPRPLYCTMEGTRTASPDWTPAREKFKMTTPLRLTGECKTSNARRVFGSRSRLSDPSKRPGWKNKELTDEACRKRRDGSGGKNLHGTFLHVFLSSPVENVTGTACAPDVASIGPTQPTSHVSNRFTETDVDPKGRRPEVRSVKGS